MAAYVILNVEVTDEAVHARYREQVAALPAAYGGRHLANTSESEVMGGEWAFNRLIMLEFPDTEQAKGYVGALGAPELQEMRAQCVGNRNVVVVAGL